MKSRIIFFLIISISIFMYSCSQSGNKDIEEGISPVKDKESKIDNGFMSSSAAVENKSDTTHKFIRTADIKFKVQNVINTTYRIEEIILNHNGFVTYTNLNSRISKREIIPVSADSSLETIYFTVSNTMELRVPNMMLDSTLKVIAKHIDYLDYRIIKANDIGLDLLSNKLTQDRTSEYEERLTKASDSKDQKLNQALKTEENLFNKKMQADKAKISNLYLQDQINFSTVNLYIYQRKDVKRWLVSNDENIEAFETSLVTKFIESLKLGWSILEAILIFIAKLWGLLLLAILAFLVYKKFGHKFRKK
ncbi:MAG TPA: DUF4349 domain-containing protein [Bacteroidales bacterium]|nr:MAG: hypothetical protein A2W98_13835 [Bacteroidetes bacterium GWF2_33_38]OFY74319.1 MAG: hypothetical protein A2265_05550 [Bacteroidetes bacterium RIFOXYA12_FULL_33_9]HBF89205.1 DUF4349 domain-containing protein [Bacteroidales bacterium]